MKQYTPGPWHVDATPDHCPCDFLIRHKSRICGAYVPLARVFVTENIETINNARLIAAAPDLLAACQRAMPWIGKLIADNGHLNSVAPNDAIGAMQQLQAALNKAEGK